MPMNETHSQALVIGVDAGGTRSRACLVAPDGTVLGRGTGGPGNALSVARPDLTLHLAAAIAGAVPEPARGRVAAVFGGFAGSAPGLGPERGRDLALTCLRDALAAHGITGAAVEVGGDTEVALASAPGAPADGLVLIAGTGAIASRLAGRQRVRVADGHGWLLGDEGSGYWLGARAVRACLAALDGRGPRTGLVAKVAAHYLAGPAGPAAPVPSADAGPARPGGVPAAAAPMTAHASAAPAAPAGPASPAGPADAGPAGPVPSTPAGPTALVPPVLPEPLAAGPAPGSAAAYDLAEAVVTRAYAQAPPRLAALSTAVVEAAAEGDAVALGLLDEAADLLAATVRALAPRAGEPLVTSGGLLGPGGPLLGRVTARLADLGPRVFPVADGAIGAAALARRLL
jgi:glucosamine kinase